MIPDTKLQGWSIARHEKAPLFQGTDASSILRQCHTLLGSGSLRTGSEDTRQVLRQAGLVNLWTFLKILSLGGGPYDRLNAELHREVGNFLQRGLEPGTKLGTCLPRGSFKSTMGTHGLNTWRLTRNPNERIGLMSCVLERAEEFYKTTWTNMSQNEVYKWLYPEQRVEGTARRFVLTNRTKNCPEPSLKYLASGSSTQGNHFDHLSADDIIGDTQLNADRSTNADMEYIKNWFKSNIRSLLVSMSRSTVSLGFTRYAVNDAYDWIMDFPREQFGYWEDWEPEERGEWQVYYRSAIEEGQSILPDVYTAAQIEQMMRTDPWTAQTQYINNPRAAGMNEFVHYEPLEFDLYRDEQKWTLEWLDATRELSENRVVRRDLSTCDIIMAVDPAGSSRRVTERTSRSCILVLAQDHLGYKYVLDVWADWAPMTTVLDRLFDMHKRWKPRTTYFETQGAFQILQSTIRREEQLRQYWLNLQFLTALGDKLQTIRELVQPELERHQLLLHKACAQKVREELKAFPLSHRLDILDALKIALKHSRTVQLDDADDDDIERPRVGLRAGSCPITGY